MKKNIFLNIAFFICLNTGSLYAQALIKITGQMVDANKKTIATSAVSLIRLKDSVLVKTTVSSEDGKFEIGQVKDGEYLLMVSSVGFKKYTSKSITVKQQNITLPLIQLQTSDANELKTVTVVAKTPFVEQKLDRTIVNVDALISNSGTNALEVLEKSPGVLVDENGNISFKGKTGVLILIDDKPTYLSAADLVTYLKSLPSSALDKIELMDNPPAKYDAAGNAGVINIKTKKAKVKGLYSSIATSYSQGVYGRYSGSINMNFRSNKINLFTNIGTYEQKTVRRLTIDRNYFDTNGSPESVFRQSNNFRPVLHSGNLKLGMDYYLSSNTTWGIVFTGSLSNTSEYRPGESYLYNNTGKLDSSIIADNYSKSTFKKSGVNLNYSHQFDTLGRSLTFDLDFVNYSSNSDQSFKNDVYYPNGVLINSQTIINQLPSAIYIYSAKTDYSMPLKGKGKIEAGLKSSYVTTDNAANYFNVVNGINTVDYNNTNRFLYKENINAVYANFNKGLKRLTLQAGLRLENTNSNGDQLGNALVADSSFVKHYINLFPTTYVSYKLDSAGNHLLNFSYGRRIGRPYYQDLNPFVFLVNKFTYFSGNPFLKPQLSSNYELSYHYKGIFTTSLVYYHATDIQIETIEQNGNVFISRTGNIGQNTYMAFTVNLSLKPAKWWSVNIFSDIQQNKYQGALYKGFIDEHARWWYITANNQFTFTNGWSAELSGYYVGSRADAQFDKIATGQLNAGLQKKIWNNKASIKLSARDIFHSFSPAGNITNIPNAKVAFKNYLDSQVVTLGFTYSFGKQTDSKQKQNAGSAEGEEDRVKN